MKEKTGSPNIVYVLEIIKVKSNVNKHFHNKYKSYVNI